jgi:hypothetical protein
MRSDCSCIGVGLTVQTTFGKVSNGFLGALHRIGDDPLLNPDLYFTLFEIFSNRQHRAHHDVLRQRSDPITTAQIEIPHRLNPILVHGNILKRLHGHPK